MNEPKRISPRPFDAPEPSAETAPAPRPDLDALSIIERRAMEMAGRKPQKRAPEPLPTFSSTFPEDAPVLNAKPANDVARWVEAKPAEPISPPAETKSAETISAVEEIPPIEEIRAMGEIRPLEDLNLGESAQTETPAPAEEIRPLEQMSAITVSPAETPAPAAEEIPPVEEIRAIETAPIEIAQIEMPAAAAQISSAEITPPETLAPIETPLPAEAKSPAKEISRIERFDPAGLLQPEAAKTPAAPVTPVQSAPPKVAPPPARPMFADHFRLTLTSFQSAAAAAVIFAFVIAAFGMAASGWASAHDWSCRVGLTSAYCPSQPVAKPLPQADIPT